MERQVRLRRVYDDPSSDDGARVLVDRVWPRGLTKAAVHLDEWVKDIAPSTPLRRWYGHRPERFTEFRDRYLVELRDARPAAALDRLRELARTRTVTLLTATRDVERSQAAVLSDLLRAARTARDPAPEALASTSRRRRVNVGGPPHTDAQEARA
ncbi:hypothetical protein DMB66_02520 [Actinoplanes sp. ATCC 53533]|uniref:DUF488 domain-containing protein n=1 Tax=Actinoplanes sp. ATCC 53533 TaxID=1288362 RepID=UPI000F794052|nr:DUF488 family protein [Actinoplanes sp. ATCC 53533]RSM73796.1 hypothetical protein DMB66_02520 [Actinoplanes sp. ATCC 53533]